jgi:aminoglycoside phosphotransferase (APT) family kinase protein
MHDGEVDIDVDLVRRLLFTQFPQGADLPLEAVSSAGTVNAIYRLGLLVEGSRLRAVIDFGNVGIGDPAVDVVAAWSVFGEDGRDDFRRALDVDDATWLRSRGFALHQALLIIPYYSDTNPAFVAMAMRTVDQVLADYAEGA